jgi:hypothetical protein
LNTLSQKIPNNLINVLTANVLNRIFFEKIPTLDTEKTIYSLNIAQLAKNLDSNNNVTKITASFDENMNFDTSMLTLTNESLDALADIQKIEFYLQNPDNNLL